MGSKSRERISGIVFDIKRYAIHDGPGIRTTIFVKGCPLRCLWCANPESQILQPEIVWFEDKCIECSKCVSKCPADAIKIDEKNRRVIQWNICTLCGECSKVCPAEALNQIGKHMTVEEVMKEIEKDIIFYTLSGGGVTISGGEPLVQWKFVREIFRKCQEEAIHTALYTCGHSSWEIMKEVLEFVDLVLYDIKVIDAEKHLKYTGVTNRVILENAKRIDSEGIPLMIRIPIIPGYNDSEKSIRHTAEFIVRLKHVKEVGILPYHCYGLQKYKRLGRQYKLENCESPTKDKLQNIREIMESYGLKVTLYG